MLSSSIIKISPDRSVDYVPLTHVVAGDSQRYFHHEEQIAGRVSTTSNGSHKLDQSFDSKGLLVGVDCFAYNTLHVRQIFGLHLVVVLEVWMMRILYWFIELLN